MLLSRSIPTGQGMKHQQMYAKSDGFFEYKWDDDDASSLARRKLDALFFLTLVQRF